MIADRRLIAAVLLALTTSSLLLTAWDAHGSGLLYLNTAFVLLAPGWAVVVHLRLPSRSLEWAAAIALGTALTLLIAQVMVSADWWHPVAAFLVLAALTLVALIPLVLRGKTTS